MKPSTPGSIKVTHRAFKNASIMWFVAKDDNDWIMVASIVQCEVSSCPMKVWGNMLPHTIYFGKPLHARL
jgi:hypothetical protein